MLRGSSCILIRKIYLHLKKNNNSSAVKICSVIFLKIWFRKTEEKYLVVTTIRGLTFIVRKKQSLCPHSLGYFFFFSLTGMTSVLHTTSSPTPLTNHILELIQLILQCHVQSEQCNKNSNLHLKLASLTKESFYFPLDPHENQVWRITNFKKKLEVIHYLNDTNSVIIG